MSSLAIQGSNEKLVVSVEAPHHILATETGLKEILHHSTNELRSLTIEVFEGPETNRSLFHSTIAMTSHNIVSKLQLVLYDGFGQRTYCFVTFTPFRESADMACMITIEKSEAILLNDTFTDLHRPQALISADFPYQLQRVNDKFLKMFSFESSEIVGQTMSILQCPSTDVFRWCALFKSATEGQVVSGSLSLHSKWQTEVSALLTCTPVVESQNGKIQFVLVQFLPTEPASVATAATIPTHQSLPNALSQRLAQFDEPLGLHMDPCLPVLDPALDVLQGSGQSLATAVPRLVGVPLPLLADSIDSNGVCSDASRARAGSGRREKKAHYPKIFPRRKANEPKSDTPSAPVVITLDLLESLSDMPLYRAAEKIGVSATALKLACRKLGVRKWQCRRRLSAETDPPAPLTSSPEPLVLSRPLPPVSAGESRSSAASPGLSPRIKPSPLTMPREWAWGQTDPGVMPAIPAPAGERAAYEGFEAAVAAARRQWSPGRAGGAPRDTAAAAAVKREGGSGGGDEEEPEWCGGARSPRWPRGVGASKAGSVGPAGAAAGWPAAADGEARAEGLLDFPLWPAQGLSPSSSPPPPPPPPPL